MTFNSSFELITGLTDLFNFVLALVLTLCMTGLPRRTRVWKWLMISISASGAAGAFYHVIHHTDDEKKIIWLVVLLTMIASPVLFFVCAMSEANEKYEKPTAIWASVGGAALFAAATAAHFINDGSLTVFTICAVVTVLSALGIFIALYVRRREKHLLLYIIGIVIQIPGGIIQATKTLRFTLILDWDYNSIYHLILSVTAVLLFIGVKMCGKSAKTAEINENNA